MVVVNPNDVATLVVCNNLVGKVLVDISVKLPRVVFVRLTLWMIRNLIMEDWPEDSFAVVSVVSVDITI